MAQKKKRKKKSRTKTKVGNAQGMMNGLRGGMKRLASGESKIVSVLLWVAVFVALFFLARRFGFL
jgi:uncharacterized protein YkvS